MKKFATYFRPQTFARMIITLVLFTFISGAAPVAAAPKTAPGGGGNQSTACTDNNNCDLVKKYVQPAVNLLAALFGTVAAASMVMGGIQYTTSEGDPQKASSAKKRITNTLIAVVAFLFLYSFLQFLIPGGIFNRSTG